MKSGIGGFSGKDWWEAGYRARKVYSAEIVKRYKGQKRTIICEGVSPVPPLELGSSIGRQTFWVH